MASRDSENPDPAAATDRARDRQKVVVRELVLDCRIGLLERERQAPQRLRIDLELEVEPPAAYDDDFAKVVDYGAIVERVTASVTANRALLLETLADRLLSDCMRDERVLAARVRLEKLDLLAEVAGLGIELSRHR
jgi:dihydroneopterin aldolase